MAVRETHVDIDFTADADPLREVNREINQTLRHTRLIGKAYDGLTDTSRSMLREMSYGWRNQNQAFYKYKNDLISAEYDYHKLATGTALFGDKTRDLMDAIKKTGAAHKKATDGMIANDDSARRSLYQTIGAMSNMTPLAEKTADAYTKMKNPLLMANNASLRLIGSLQRIANNANPAAIALERLGPKASMKELQDEIRRINQGLTAMPMALVAAAGAAFFLYKGLWKAAKGPDPSTVFQKQAEALAKYRDAVKARTKEIAEAWNIFENIKLKKTSGKQLMANLQEQVTAMTKWKSNLGSIASRAGTEFANYLSRMGPQSAGEVAKIASMTGPQLDKYVSLWRQKMSLSKDAATTELQKLKAETSAEIKKLQRTLTPLGLSAEKLKKVWTTAFQPMVQVFSMIMVPVVKFSTVIGKMINKFNQAHPVIAKMIQGTMMLVPALTLLLLPLGLGVGLFKGWRLAIQSLMTFAGPLITFFATMSATVWIVAAAIIALGAAFIWAWNNVAWFRDGIISAWNWIKSATLIACNLILNSVIKPIFTAISTFISSKLAEIKAFWQQNGAQILEIAKLAWDIIKIYLKGVMTYIKGIFQIVWPIITGIVKTSWNLIKLTINTAIDIIKGIIKTVLAIIRGDWEGAWKSIKQIAIDIWNNIENFFKSVDLVDIGKNIIQGLIDGIGSMVGAVGKTVSGIVGKIKKSFTSPLEIHSPSRLFKKYGQNTLQGYNIGIGDEMKNVQTVMHKFASIPMSYAPATTSTSTVNKSSRSITNDIKITVQGGGGSNSNIKQQVKEAMEEVFEYLNLVYEPEEAY